MVVDFHQKCSARGVLATKVPSSGITFENLIRKRYMFNGSLQDRTDYIIFLLEKKGTQLVLC